MSAYTTALLISVATTLSISALVLSLKTYVEKWKAAPAGTTLGLHEAWSLMASLLSVVLSLIVILSQPLGSWVGWLAGALVVGVAYLIVRRLQ